MPERNTTRRVGGRLLLLAVLCAGTYAAWHWRGAAPHWLPVPPPASPHESYERALERAGLGETALGEAWRAAARHAIERPLDARPDFIELLAFPPDAPHAVGYRFDLQRGQRLRVVAEPEDETSPRVFVDLFEVREDGPERVTSAADDEASLEQEIRRRGTYVLRVQPELLRGGRVRVTQRVEGALRFPVHEQGKPAVQSHFGDPRDGGRREHHGIDIFAPRGTAVLAAAGGVVSSVTTNPLGGNVVWVWDLGRMQSHYYAHLDEQFVSAGDRVEAGDPVGTVGNTGNARTTPPHLHFGIYSRGEGPIDPLPFVMRPAAPPAAVRAPVDPLGAWARTLQPRVPLRRAASPGGQVVEQLPRGATVRVVASSDRFHRVRSLDGLEGYVEARAIARTEPPFEDFTRRGDAVAAGGDGLDGAEQ